MIIALNFSIAVVLINIAEFSKGFERFFITRYSDNTLECTSVTVCLNFHAIELLIFTHFHAVVMFQFAL